LNLAGGEVKMFPVTKVDTEDDERLALDLILVTPSVEMVWSTAVVPFFEQGFHHRHSGAGFRGGNQSRTI
jgi:hypothetical protein